jgi:hypothetical protein
MPTDSSLGDLEDLVPEPSDENTRTEDAQAPVEDTPSDVTEIPEVDYEKRYKDLQSWATQRDQERLQELEEAKARLEQYEALQQQPVQPRYRDDDEDYEEPVYDPLADPRVQAHLNKVSQLEAKLAEREQREAAAMQQERDYAHIDAYLDQVEATTKKEFDPRVATWIGREALANRDPVTGAPDVEGAYASYRQIIEAEKAQWVSSKPGRGAAPASGPGAVEVPDLDDPDARGEYLDRIAGEMFPN